MARRLFIEDPTDSIVNFTPLRRNIKQYVLDNGLSGSVYFEYLPTGTSIRIDGDAQQVAASLLKLPVAMDAFKAAEQGKVDLNALVTLKEEWLDSNFGELYRQGAGYQLSLRQAIKIMLTDSDNTALNVVTDAIGNSLPVEDQAYNSLDVDVSQNADQTLSISARSYSSFLKCLYFSCYNKWADSQEILSYLTETKYNDRLPVGISDPSIKIAHKIGINGDANQGDCGIVYVPKRNYALCVMIPGQDNAASNAHIADISRMAYDYVSKL